MDDKEIVSAVHARLADSVGANRYETWLANGTRLTFTDGRLIVSAPSAHLQELQRKLFRQELTALCAEITGRAVEVQFVVDTSDAEEDASGPATIPLWSLKETSDREAKSSGEPRPAASGQSANSKPVVASQPVAISRKTHFDQYVVGPCNQMALHSAQLVLSQPGKMTPLTLYGRAGLGKTHLLESLLTSAREQRIQALYLSAEKFTSLYIEACQGKGVPSFRQKYRGVDLLLIDDIHFFARTRGTLIELLYTIETLQKAGKQLVFAADRSPRELTELGPEISGRLNAGLHCEIVYPDFMTRRGIVQELCRRMQLTLPAGIDGYLALHISGTARDIAGALNRLDAMSHVYGQPLTREQAEEIISSLVTQTSRVVQLKDIQREVCDLFGVTAESLHSTRRGEEVHHPRMLAMFLARKHTRAALGEISRYFGRRSHSTVITANRTVESWMAERRTLTLARQKCDVEQAIRRIEDRLQAM